MKHGTERKEGVTLGSERIQDKSITQCYRKTRTVTGNRRWDRQTDTGITDKQQTGHSSNLAPVLNSTRKHLDTRTQYMRIIQCYHTNCCSLDFKTVLKYKQRFINFHISTKAHLLSAKIRSTTHDKDAQNDIRN